MFKTSNNNLHNWPVCGDFMRSGADVKDYQWETPPQIVNV